MIKIINLQLQQTQSTKEIKQMTPNRKSKKHIIIKLFQNSIKEENLKSIQRKTAVH